MKKSLLCFLSIITVSYANAYTLGFPENVVFKNKQCSLELGQKEFRKGRLQGEPDIMFQEAVLMVKNKEYTFSLEEMRHKKDQESFGRLNGQTFPTSVYITKIDDNAIKLKAIAEDWHGRTDVRFDCGVMISDF